MTFIKVGAACLNQTPLDWTGNKDRILKAVNLAKSQGVTLLCLPELCITGYGCEDFFHSPEVSTLAFAVLQDILQQAPQDIAFCVGLPVVYFGAVYNTVAVIQNGMLQCLVAKQHLAGDGVHYEPRWFKPWPKDKVDTIQGTHIGDVVLDFSGILVGFEICEDAWVADRPGASLARRGVDIILNPSASHFTLGKNQTRRQFITAATRAFKVTYVYANLLGNEAGRLIYDGDCIIAGGPEGDILSEGPRLKLTDVELTTAVIDTERTRVSKLSSASFSPEFQGTIISCFKLSNCWEALSQKAQPETLSEFEEFEAAVPLGLWDYLLKSHSKGFVISLSGGADSTVCAYLVRLAFTRALLTHGSEIVETLLGTSDFSEVLTCVYQKTRNSSEQSLLAAQAVAKDIGCKFIVLDVDSLVQSYTETVSQGLGRTPTWETDDIALQNIQARVRAPGVWMLANLENKLLLTTSNRSEAAVGYCTMDGDTAGSLAPIAGVSKTFLLQWLKSDSLQTMFPSVHCVIALKPSAELRPGQGQTDETDLMPYDVLDAIETEAISNKRPPLQTYIIVSNLFPEVVSEELLGWVETFFRLWFRNQWKREKLPLSFQIAARSLDPRTWCKTPILSAGYTEELAMLRDMVENGDV